MVRTLGVQGLGVWGSGFRIWVQGLGSRTQVEGFRVQGLGCFGFKFRVERCRLQGLRFSVEGPGSMIPLRFWGSGVRLRVVY